MEQQALHLSGRRYLVHYRDRLGKYLVRKPKRSSWRLTMSAHRTGCMCPVSFDDFPRFATS